MRRCCCRHRATDTDNAPEAVGRRGGRAAATFAVGVLHGVETRRASRGSRARRRRSPRPQPLQLPLPKQLSLPSCTTALARRQHASDGELLALHKPQARTEERRADVARGVSSRSAEERRRFASDSTISRRCMYRTTAGRRHDRSAGRTAAAGMHGTARTKGTLHMCASESCAAVIGMPTCTCGMRGASLTRRRSSS